MKKSAIFAGLFASLLSMQLASAQVATPTQLTLDQCLQDARLRYFPGIKAQLDGGRKIYRAALKDPYAYEKTLPRLDMCVAKRDIQNFKYWGQLAQHFASEGDKDKALSIYKVVAENADYMLGEKNHYLSLIQCDLGIYFYELNDFEAAESCLIHSIRHMEKYYDHTLKLQLYSDYKIMAALKDKQGNLTEAGDYARKMIDMWSGARGSQLLAGTADKDVFKTTPAVAVTPRIKDNFDPEAEAEKVVAAMEAKERAEAAKAASKPKPQPLPQPKPKTETQTETQTATNQSNIPVRDKWALVIGISNFKKPGINLKYASKDARDFYNYLVNEAGFRRDHICLLLDKDATRENIMTAFGSKFLPAVCEEGDMVVIFISTHGTPSNKDSTGKRNYIVAYDTDPNNLFPTGVDMDDMYDRIRESGVVERTLVVMDTCYSGAGVPGKGLSEEANFDAGSVAQGTGTLVITSSSNDEKSYESTNTENGVFTKHFLKALRKAGKTTDVKTAFEDVREGVRWEVKSTLNKSQMPQLGGEWEGANLILAAPATKPREAYNVPFASTTTIITPGHGALKPAVKKY